MYRTIYFLSLIVFVFTLSSLAASNVEYPVKDQLPLIARVGQQYTWSISPNTFSATAEPSLITVSSLPSWLTFSNLTFSGTPSAQDEGNFNITVSSGDTHDTFSICVTHFPPPTLHIPLENQFISSNPSLSSAFPLQESFTLTGGKPTLRVPLRWSFSVGIDYDTFKNNNDLYYYAQQANGSQLPGWINFDAETATFDGVARTPPLEEGQIVELMLIASDQAGYSAVHELFNIFIQSRSIYSLGFYEINATANESFEHDFKHDTLLFRTITIDNSSITSDNITFLSIDNTFAKWLSFDSDSRTIFGTTPNDGSYILNMTITTCNETFFVNTTLNIFPSFFTSQLLPDMFVLPGSTFSHPVSSYLSDHPSFSSRNVTLSVNSSAKYIELTVGHDGEYVLGGSVPENPGNYVDVQLIAYDHYTHCASHASVRMIFRGSGSDAAMKSALSKHRRLILGIGIGLGSLAILLLMAGTMAIIRKCCQVQDSAIGLYRPDEKTITSSDVQHNTPGYGWSEKVGLGISEVDPVSAAEICTIDKRSNKNFQVYKPPNTDIGVGFPPFSPGSPQVTKTTKAAFFQNFRNALRSFSGSQQNISPATRKSAISKPIIMFTKESLDSLRALREAAGLNVDTTTGIHGPAQESYEMGVDSFSLGLSSGLCSVNQSPSSSTGRSNETGKRSIPKQRPDFRPPLRDISLHAEYRSKQALDPKTVGSIYPEKIRNRGEEIQVIQSPDDFDRERDLEEAVIVTASRATSVHSVRSSGYSYVPSTLTKDSPVVKTSSYVQTRPRLVQFKGARDVPIPINGRTLNVDSGTTLERRIVSQRAAIISPHTNEGPGTFSNEADPDTIMTEGMRYVRAFGDQTEDLKQTKAQQYGSLPPTSFPSPSRSNSCSKRSSKATQSSTGKDSTTPTQTSYVFPTPSQSYDSGKIAPAISEKGSSRDSRGERGSLMMSRIIVRVGEPFAFKYPISLHSNVLASQTSSGTRKLVARSLYSGKKLPPFLSHSVSPMTTVGSGKKRRERYEWEFWGKATSGDLGEIFIGFFEEGEGGKCVGRLTLDVTKNANVKTLSRP